MYRVFMDLKNKSESLGEREVLWEREPHAGDFTAVSSSFKLSGRITLYIMQLRKKLNVKRLIVRHTQCTDERTSFLCHLYMHVLCLQAIEDRFRISTKELLKFEFQAVIALEFDLHVPQWEVLPHAKRMETE